MDSFNGFIINFKDIDISTRIIFIISWFGISCIENKRYYIIN